MRRLDDAMKLGSPPHIRFIKIDDAGAATASRLAHGHKTLPVFATARSPSCDGDIAHALSRTQQLQRVQEAGLRQSAWSPLGNDAERIAGSMATDRAARASESSRHDAPQIRAQLRATSNSPASAVARARRAKSASCVARLERL